ncbi:MAG: indole-3-glycerol phosphate synthase TrpC [Cytophagaceae bacterium]
MNILDKIIEQKRIEVAQRKATTSVETLKSYPLYGRKTLSLRQYLTNPALSGIIAEHKRKSPSKGIINGNVEVKQVVQGYQTAGASACSVLTDTEFFGGTTEDLIQARGVLQIPILRKDFMVDTYQIEEAKAMGADVILLIAACLTNAEVKELSEYAHKLGLEVLLEVHDADELKGNLLDTIDVIGVNNRNLKTFEVSVETSIEVGKHIPEKYIKISESGIDDPETIVRLKQHGFKGFLIGESFMKQADPGAAMKKMVSSI